MMRLLQIVALGTVIAFATQVSAQTVSDDITVSRQGSGGKTFYVGGAAGLADYDKADDSDVGLSLFGGYSFTDVFAAEVGWLDFGEAEDDGASLEVTAIYLSLVGSLQLRADSSLYGKLGLLEWDGDASTNGSSTSDSDSEGFLGFGGNVGVGGTSSLRFEIDFIPIGDENIVFYSVGFIQGF